jgi:hypothetical protein
MAALSYWQQLDAMVAEYKAANTPSKPVRPKLPPRAQLPKTQIEPVEWLIAFKMQSAVTFVPGSSHKRFIRELSVNSQLTDRGRAYLAYIAHRYRRQWKPSQEEFEWIVRWAVYV